jgi:hypothetical protein
VVAVGCETTSKMNAPFPTSEITPIDATTTPVEIPTVEAGPRNFGGVQVEVNEEGLPFKYSLPNGIDGTFDVSQMRIFRNKAIVQQEVEFASHMSYEGPSFDEIYKESPEKPRTLELPKDVMSEDELRQKGVEIIQGDTKLYIRHQAFEADGPLAAFDGQGRKLIIAAVDGPYDDKEFMRD